MQRPRSVLNLFSTRHTTSVSSSARPRRRSITRLIVSSLACALVVGCCGPNDPNCRNVSIGPSGAEVAGVAIGVGAAVTAVVAVEVHHAHHTLKGCVADGPAGMQLQTQGGARSYLLSGNTADIKAGERVRLHGTRVKQKGSTTGPTFFVERENKDFGPCKQTASSTPLP